MIRNSHKSRRKYRRNYSRKSHNKRFTRGMKGGCSWTPLGTYNIFNMKATPAETMAQISNKDGIFYYGSGTTWNSTGTGFRDSNSTNFFISKKDKNGIDITQAGGLPLTTPEGSYTSKYIFMLENQSKTSSVMFAIDTVNTNIDNSKFITLKFISIIPTSTKRGTMAPNTIVRVKGAPSYNTTNYTLYYNSSCPAVGQFPTTPVYSAIPFYVKK